MAIEIGANTRLMKREEGRTRSHNPRQIRRHARSRSLNDLRKLIDRPVPERGTDIGEDVEAGGFGEETIVWGDDDGVFAFGVV